MRVSKLASLSWSARSPRRPAWPSIERIVVEMAKIGFGPGNGILRAETGGLFQAQNAGEQSEFGSQTPLRLTNPPELRGFLSTRKPPQFVGTAWWGMQESN